MSPKHVSFVEAIKLFFINYVNFKGRSTRSEYWWIVLFNFLVSVVLSVLSLAVGIADKNGNSVLTTLWSLAVLVPGWSAVSRRLHDTGRSFVHAFIIFVPVAGPFILLVWLAAASDGDNIWGFCADSIAMGRGTSNYNPQASVYNPYGFYDGSQQPSYGGQPDPNNKYDPNSFYTGDQQNSYNDPNSFYNGNQQNSYNDPNSFYNGNNDQQGFGGNSINNNNRF